MSLPQVIILAAGEAKRLLPLSNVLPKILIPVYGRPLGEHIMKHIAKHGGKRVLLCVNEKYAEFIKSFFRDGSQYGLEISYSVSRGLGTAGEIWNACKQNLIEDDFMIYYGDIITDLNLSKFWQAHKETNSDLTIAVSDNVQVPFGVIATKPSGSISMHEKPKLSDFKFCPNHNYFATIGILAANNSTLYFFSPHLDIFSDVIPQIISMPEYQVQVFPEPVVWWDCGSFKSIQKAEAWLQSRSRE